MAKNDDIRSRLLLSLMINHFETEWEIKIESSLWHQNKKWSTDIPSEGCIRIIYNHWPPAPHSFLLIKKQCQFDPFWWHQEELKSLTKIKKKTDPRGLSQPETHVTPEKTSSIFNRQFTSFASFCFLYWTFYLKTMWPISLYLLQ